VLGYERHSRWGPRGLYSRGGCCQIGRMVSQSIVNFESGRMLEMSRQFSRGAMCVFRPLRPIY